VVEAMGQSGDRGILPAAPGWDALRLAGGAAGGAAGGLGGRAVAGPALERAARDFEAVFVRMILEATLQGETTSFFGAGASAGVMRNLFLDQIGSAVAARKPFGIASLVEKSMARRTPEPFASEKSAGKSETHSWRG